MRPFSWIIRVSLFAVGFGIGLAHHKPSTPQRPIVLELHFAIPPQAHSQLSRADLHCVAPAPLRTGRKGL
jgi:hypothetical protein